jgi:hypothetical protein
MKKFNRIFLTIVALILPFTALADEWPGGFLARVETTALIETLNAELLSNLSATLALERCAAPTGWRLFKALGTSALFLSETIQLPSEAVIGSTSSDGICQRRSFCAMDRRPNSQSSGVRRLVQ